MAKRLIFTFIILILLLAATSIIIAFGRGYRFNLGNQSITSTGILSASSYPEGASIFINGTLKSATNTSINIDPGHYHIKITKEGYIPWEKDIAVQGEIVTKVDALLLPINPSLRPLTSSGILSPVLSPTNLQLAYIVPFEATAPATIKNKEGIWIWNLKEGPLVPFGNAPKLLALSTSNLDFTNSHLLWSPDEKQILAVFFKDDQIDEEHLSSIYLLDTQLREQVPILVTDSLSSILVDWNIQQQEKDQAIISSLPPTLASFLSNSVTKMDYSPDENKLMYTATSSGSLPLVINPPLIGANTTAQDRMLIPGSTYIYDIKEDKNFKISSKSPLTPTPSPKPKFTGITPSPTPTESPLINLLSLFSATHRTLRWYADSKHIVILDNGTIYIEEYDGQNKTTVYAGPFEDNYIFPWPGGGRILILTNYNKAASIYPNLFAVDLR